MFLGARNPDRLAQVSGALAAAEPGGTETFQRGWLGGRSAIEVTDKLANRICKIDAVINATSRTRDQGTTVDGLDQWTFSSPAVPSSDGCPTTKATTPHMGNTRPGVFLTMPSQAGRTGSEIKGSREVPDIETFEDLD